jgi:hypothetical protein
MNQANWWQEIEPASAALLAQLWVPVGAPGHAGPRKGAWQQQLDARYGADGWRLSHYVRGRIVTKPEALREYEQSYRLYLQSRPALVEFLVTVCGNVYDDRVSNVFDEHYEQPHTAANHYQDIAIRRVISELVDDLTWPQVVETPVEEADLIDLNDGQSHRLPRARGFRGHHLLQVRGATSPGFLLNPAVVPVHDPALVIPHPQIGGWFLREGCAHLSVEAFWQMSKVVEVRYDRFLALGPGRERPLAGLATDLR